ncbi:hypothetical protein CVT26_012138 [Gymnopilus dilepis]|uniref:Uncharacterized protein n=1 Tax=Gymnopilus dilepis TaxID=231916 RepID=A0A409W5M6_9AGAR|nr:hypothetical protein CVT26_012138 [Gymnopilus dilepis]
MAQTLILVKGIADVAVAAILTFKPAIIYESFLARAVHSFSELHLTDASTAPGFNQSVACMVAAVGVGHVVASKSGPASHASVFAMNLTFSILGFLACALPSRESGIGSATMLMTSCNHLLFSLALLWADPGVLGGRGSGTGKKRS